MLKDPVGVFLLIVCAIYWGFVLFKPAEPTKPENPEQPQPEGKKGKQSIPLSLVVLVIGSLATSAAIYALIQNIEKTPAQSLILLGVLGYLLYLLLAKPEKFALVLVGGIVVFGLASMLGQCSNRDEGTWDGRRLEEVPYNRR